MLSIDYSLFILMASFIFLVIMLNIILYRPIRTILIKRKNDLSSTEEITRDLRHKAGNYMKGYDGSLSDAKKECLREKEALKNQLSLFRSKTFEERKKIPGLPVARADVILAGAAILYLTMEEVQCPSVLISCHGVRYGLIYRRLTL